MDSYGPDLYGATLDELDEILIQGSEIIVEGNEPEVAFAATSMSPPDAAELECLRSMFDDLEDYRQFKSFKAKKSLLRDMASLVGNSDRTNVSAPGAQPYGEAPRPTTDSWGNQLPNQRGNTVLRQSMPNTFENRDTCVTERAPREAPLAHSSFGQTMAQNPDMSIILANLVSQMRLQSDMNSPWLSTFSGLPEQDPVEFAQDIASYCQDNAVRGDDAKRVLLNRVKGDAKLFVEKQLSRRQSFDDILHRLVINYNSPENLATASTLFYTENQLHHQDVETFALKKQALFKRIHPNGPLRNLLGAVIERLRPEIRVHLRLASFLDIEDLIARSSRIEKDLGLISQTNRREAQRTEKVAEPSTKPTITCRICGGNHLSFRCNKKSNETKPKLAAIEGPTDMNSNDEFSLIALEDAEAVESGQQTAAEGTTLKGKKSKRRSKNV